MALQPHVALLRGINVGGHHKVPMAELRTAVSSLGFERVATYIQSGNLVFHADLPETEIVAALESEIEDRFGFSIPVVVRTGSELAAVGAEHPFADSIDDARFLMVAFLDEVPPQPVASVIDPAAHDPDRFVGSGREVYLGYPNGSGRSRLSHALLEQRLGVRATVRNWRTVQKLVEMVGTYE